LGLNANLFSAEFQEFISLDRESHSHRLAPTELAVKPAWANQTAKRISRCVRGSAWRPLPNFAQLQRRNGFHDRDVSPRLKRFWDH
jgi:hypothetical protein